MTGRQVSQRFREAVFAQNTGEVFICLLTITHPSFEEDILLSDDPLVLLPDAGVRGVVSRDAEYIYLPFTFKLPMQDDTGVGRASISIDNVNRDIVDAIRSADSAVNINIEIVLSSDPDNVEVSIQDFRLEEATYDALTVSGDISVEYYDLEPYPYAQMTPSYFPGMF
jgi:hypothetical protein